MWLVTNFGFFSIVAKSQDATAGKLTIRARVQSDLVTLRERYLPSLGEIIAGGGTDYPFRARASREATADALLKAALDIDYGNFKNSVSEAMGDKRSILYYKVWSALRALEKGGFELPPPDAATETATQFAKGTPATRGAAYGGVLFNEKGQVLLIEPTGHYDNTVWTWPKGRPNTGETAEQTALREVLEETGYGAAIVAKLPGAWKGTTGTTEYFLMKPQGPQGAFQKETASTKWVDPSEAPALIKETTKPTAQQRDLEVLTAAVERACNRLSGPPDQEKPDITNDLLRQWQWFDAIEGDDVATVRHMLATAGPDLLRAGKVLEDQKAQTPLHVAAHHGAVEVIGLLLAQGVEPNECLRDSGDAPGFVEDVTILQTVPITPLDWAAHAGHEDVVRILLAHGADPNGKLPVSSTAEGGHDDFPEPWFCPLSRTLRLPHEAKRKGRAKALRTTAHKICRRLLIAGADPNRIMTVGRWVGTPLAFAWRILESKDLCMLLLDHGAELFTDDLSSIRGAIRREMSAKRSELLARSVICGLIDPNKRYRWGVPLAPFAIYTDAHDHRQENARYFLEAGADPTLIFKHSLFYSHNMTPPEIKPLHLNALGAILNELDDPDRQWSLGATLWDAWEDAPTASLSKGGMLFDMARDPATSHVGFNAVSDVQKAVRFQLTLNAHFEEEGAWGLVKYLNDNWPRKEYKGYAIVVQFLHDTEDTIRFWLQNKMDSSQPECAAEESFAVTDFSNELASEVEDRLRGHIPKEPGAIVDF